MSEAQVPRTNTLEAKQYTLRFKCDTQSHLHVLDYNLCAERCPDKLCTLFCPGEVYKWEEDKGRMSVGYEGCHECGSCRIGCPQDNISWDYPKGGYGVVFRLA